MITRKELGWTATNAATANTDLGMVVHYDGSNQRLASKTCGACRTYWLNTRKYHMQGHGWADIGYAYGVCPHGNIYEGRGYGRQQAAAAPTPGKLQNGNSRWINVTFMSGPNEPPTVAQIRAFQELRTKLRSERKIGADIKGHRDFTSTSCPGNILYQFIKDDAFKALSEGPDDVSAKDVWNHEIKVPWGTTDNPDWQADSLLVEVNKRIRDVEIKLDTIIAALANK